MSKRSTGYVNAKTIIDVNKTSVTFVSVYKADIQRKIDETYNTYYNKSTDNIPTSISSLNLIRSFMQRLDEGDYNNLNFNANILTDDEFIRLKTIVTLGKSTNPDITISPTYVPDEEIAQLTEMVDRFRELKTILTDPDLRNNYFKVYPTALEYTVGESNFDALIISNSEDLNNIINEIDTTANDLQDQINGPVNGINKRLEDALTTQLNQNKTEAILFSQYFVILLRYLYYGCRKFSDTDTTKGILRWDANVNNKDNVVKLKAYLNGNASYVGIYLPDFDRFDTEPTEYPPYSKDSFGKSYRKLISIFYGGAFNEGYVTNPAIDIFQQTTNGMIADLYYGSNAYKANLNNKINPSIKQNLNFFGDMSNTDLNTVYESLNVMMRLSNSYTITGMSGYNTANILDNAFQTSLRYSVGTVVYHVNNPEYRLTTDFYGVTTPPTWNGSTPTYITINAPSYTLTSQILPTMYKSYPIIRGLWDNAEGSVDRNMGGSLNLKHKCNMLIALLNGDYSNGTITGKEFDETDLLNTWFNQYTCLGALYTDPYTIFATSQERTFYLQILSALNIPLFAYSGAPYKHFVSDFHTFDKEGVRENEFHGITIT